MPSPPTDPDGNRAVRSRAPAPQMQSIPGAGPAPLTLQQSIEHASTISRAAVTPESHTGADEQEIGSDADVESNDGDLESSGVGSSWVSLGPQEETS